MIKRNGHCSYEESESIDWYDLKQKNPTVYFIDRKPRRGNGVWDDELQDHKPKEEEPND
jgi:hypothetical protein